MSQLFKGGRVMSSCLRRTRQGLVRQTHVKGLVMGIERLAKAADAAGYALAPHESEPADDAADFGDGAVIESRALTVVTSPATGASTIRSAFNSAGTWLKAYLPSVGGRAPA